MSTTAHTDDLHSYRLELAQAFPGCAFDVSPPAPARPDVLVTWVDGPTEQQIAAAGAGPHPGDYRRTLSNQTLATIAVQHWLRSEQLPRAFRDNDVDLTRLTPDITRFGLLFHNASTNSDLLNGYRPHRGLPARMLCRDLISELIAIGRFFAAAAGIDVDDLATQV